MIRIFRKGSVYVMALSPQEILNIASQDFILGNTTVEEQIEFIEDQIADPFDSGTTNHFKRLRNNVKGDRLDEICQELFSKIEDRYPSISFDFSDTDQRLDNYFNCVYKFFVRNIQKLMYIFLREYLYNAKNRKVLVVDYLNMKLPNYPKEQYGKKEFYILIAKLPSIVKDICDDDISLIKFIDYIDRAGNSPMFISRLRELVESGIVCDHGVVNDLFKLFLDSDAYDPTLCKLQMNITEHIINPYLEENGILELRIPPVEPVEEADDDDEEDEDD